MFHKILIANRGEIACRVAETAKRLGIKTVAVYSDIDAMSKHVLACDESVFIGGSAPQESYLKGAAIIQAAKDTGAQAIHPGYGFLSESNSFAQACADAGIIFIGPSPYAIEAMGLKARSKQLMSQAGVPVVPGYHGEDQDRERLLQEANAIGYPVLIKASAGGGGKGMRIVEGAADFASALMSCQREAQGSFDDASVLIERYVHRPRHIEVQIFGDSHGNCVYLFERDCSVQRRYQKVLEEAPAPGMTQELRKKMGETAVAAARAVNYVGAGTVEFIVEQVTDHPMRYFFMEMNTRLQVEHPVTEAITGLDLVEWQLRVANGEPLPLEQDQLCISGHSIEARICAETPNKNFLPTVGVLNVYRKPVCREFSVVNDGVRLDSGIRQGDQISSYYDSMLAKLIVHGATREEALSRMDVALSQVHVVGLPTNVQFLRNLIQSSSFVDADLDTALIVRESEALFHQEGMKSKDAAICALAFILDEEEKLKQMQLGALNWIDPWSEKDSWEILGKANRYFDFVVDGSAIKLLWSIDSNGKAQVQQENFLAPLIFSHQDVGLIVQWGDHLYQPSVYYLGHEFSVFTNLGATVVTWVNPLSHDVETTTNIGRLTAPMSGKLVSFLVAVGDRVTQGQALAVMDAMKMEHTISAPKDGVVTELLFCSGEQVVEGAELLTVDD